MKDHRCAFVAPGLGEFEEMAASAIESLPEPFRGHARSIAFQVAEFATDEQLNAVDISDPFELTGLYEGCPITERSYSEQPLSADMVWLFRRPIIDEWAARGDVALGELVTHIVVHELAHHFGWSDDDIAEIDRWWE